MLEPFWRRPVYILICATAVVMISVGIRQSFGLFLKPITIELGWEFGVFASAIAIQNLMIGIGALVASQSEGRWSLYVANGLLIVLLGKAAMITPLVANVTHWFDRRRGLAVAIIASGQGLAGTIWPRPKKPSLPPSEADGPVERSRAKTAKSPPFLRSAMTPLALSSVSTRI